MKTIMMTLWMTLLDINVPPEITDPTIKLLQLVKYLCLIAGGVVVLLGLVQFGTSQMNQDPAGRQKALFVLLGGIIITASPFILQLLIPGISF